MTATVQAFEAHRRRLFGIAYRMLGSAAEAEDIVQEAWLRWSGEARADVRSDAAYLTTIVTRLCLDHLKSAQARRVEYVGPWLPEPLAGETLGDGSAEPDAQSLSLAFLVLLESLTPLERAAYLLHEIFDYGHAEIARMLGVSEAYCRQLAHRARAHVLARRPRFAPTQEAHRRLLAAFARASAAGDVAALERLLAADVAAWSDGGGKADAARKPLFGPRQVARLYAGLGRGLARGMLVQIVPVNGWPALAVFDAGRLLAVIDIESDGERIYSVRGIVNPDKLARLRLAPPGGAPDPLSVS